MVWQTGRWHFGRWGVALGAALPAGREVRFTA